MSKRSIIVPMHGGPVRRAAAAPAHLDYGGGPLLTSVQVQTIFWGSAWQQLDGLITYLNQFFDSILTSSLLDALSEYSVPGRTISHGQRIGSSTITSVQPNGGSAPASDAKIQQAIEGWLRSGSIPQANSNTLYFVYLPPNVSVVDPQGDVSCQTMCGYHWYIANTDPEVYYAVMPFPACSGCQGGLSTQDALTSISSHELCEAITDPHPPTGWYDNANGEIGDICAWQTGSVNGFTVQKEWSNAQGACVLAPSPQG
jgi:hypothetical protein